VPDEDGFADEGAASGELTPVSRSWPAPGGGTGAAPVRSPGPRQQPRRGAGSARHRPAGKKKRR
jgi:hypothetical protein